MSSVLVAGADGTAKAAQAAALTNNSKYRAYVTAVDKALKSFETTNEWADLISALAKLNRVFHSNAKFGDIPKPVTIAKRLSQCLHPALPHGVHLKALETYRQLFDILGRKDLPRLLYLFAVGLFPLMDHCGIKVKSELLGIFEQYLLPLSADLKPALPGFITGVLLGLEEGTEFYDRSFSLLDRVQDSVGSEAFFACLWEAVLGSPNVRLPAFIYANAKFDRRRSMDDQLYIMGTNIDHMIAALCAAAEDSGTTLVQRNLLDFICAAFPLNSDHLVRDDFIQLLRRCLFLVLRRDMSLNRRLYQWLLNRIGDSAVGGLPIAGVEEHIDTTFFKTYVLSSARKAIEDYLNLGMVEVSSGAASWDGTKEIHLEFAEVRVCRLLLYFMDRPEIGSLILEETLSMLLEFASRYNPEIANFFAKEMNSLDTKKQMNSSSSPTSEKSRQLSITSRSSVGSRQSKASISLASDEDKISKEQLKRCDEFRKTINLLMNSLDVGFIWEFLAQRLQLLINEDKSSHLNGSTDQTFLTNESRMLKEEEDSRTAKELRTFSTVVFFCLKTIELDSHGDIRELYLPQFLSSVLTTIADKNVSSVDIDLLIELLIVCKVILNEVSQSAVVIESGVITRKKGDANQVTECDETKETEFCPADCGAIKEQWRVEVCLSASQRLLVQICDWYCKNRNGDRLNVFYSITSLLRHFAIFPLYSVGELQQSKAAITQQKYPRNNYPVWLLSLMNVISLDDWVDGINGQGNTTIADFAARADALDLVICIYVNSMSVAEQHAAVIKRQQNSLENFNMSNSHSAGKVPTTTILLKPMLSVADLNRIDNDWFFKKVASILWSYLGNPQKADCHVAVARLLTILHARKSNEPSSDVEDLIVSHLTCADTMLNSDAAKKFYSLWMLCRSVPSQEMFIGLPFKPFNRVVMLFLSFLSDAASTFEKIELKNIASSWFSYCAEHGDLPFILQMWATMLLNPSTARVSIQHLTVHSRIDREQVFSLPHGVCVVKMMTESCRQTLHHLCENVCASSGNDVKQHLIEAIAASEQSRVGNECPIWFFETRNRLLQDGDSSAVKMDSNSQPCHSHRRTVSEIPIFDDDNESVESLLDDSLDHEVIDTVQFLIDCICDDCGEESIVQSLKFKACEYSPDREHSKVLDEMNTESTTIMTDEILVFSQNPKQSVDENIVKAQPLVPSVESSAKTENVKKYKGHKRQDSLQETIFSMSALELKSFDASELPHLNTSDDEMQPLCHELHAHMLVYVENGRTVDLARIEKLLRMMIAIMHTQRGFTASRLIVSSMVTYDTNSLAKYSFSSNSQMMDLLNRHVRTILGQDFWTPADFENNNTDSTKSKNYTFLELFMTISLYFLRSYFLNSPTATVSRADLRCNWKCKIAVLDFLTELMRELIILIRENQSQLFVSAPLSVDILNFNEGTVLREEHFRDLTVAYQSSLLDLSAAVIQLELVVKTGLQDFPEQAVQGVTMDSLTKYSQIYNSPQHRLALREPIVGIVELRMFLLTVLNALKKHPYRQEHWLTFILRILPFLDRPVAFFDFCNQYFLSVVIRSLSAFAVNVVEQLSKNLEDVMNAAYRTDKFKLGLSMSDDSNSSIQEVVYPTNYAISTLETITTFLHFCMLDSTVQSNSSNTTPHHTRAVAVNNFSLASSVMNAIPGTKGATELFSNLVKVFSFSDGANVATNASLSKLAERSAEKIWKQAKTEILNTFPHTLSTVCEVWSLMRSNGEPQLPVGSSAQIHDLIINLLTPIVEHHQQPFLTSLALVWMTRSSHNSKKSSRTDSDQSSFSYSSAQLDIIDLLLSIKVFGFEDLISTVGESLKECVWKSMKLGVINEKQNSFPIDLALLEILHGCIRSVTSSTLQSCWSSLQTLFIESPIMNLPPKAIFILFITLADFIRSVANTALMDDKQVLRTAQDCCQKLTEAINVIVGWQLEQTTWLKRTLVVKHDSAQKSQEASPVVEFATAPTSLAASENSSLRGSTTSLVPSRIPAFDTATQITISSQGSSAAPTERRSAPSMRSSLKDPNNPKRDPTQSTQALFLLAGNLTELIDSICKSEDKDRLIPMLHSVWNNTLPYLKAKNARNARFFLASSQLLASMSNFNFMRPVWRKTTLDLLLDPAFFKMDMQSLKHWLMVIDNLMTQDKTSFKELLARISTTQNSALSSLITSREVEYEMRAQALKRLAFIVLSSELDQYQTQLPEIQERLSENLRLSQVPIVHAQVFLCYRVLLIRLKPIHLVSMWPSMVTELVHVLLQIEQQLNGGTNVSDDLKCDRNDQWMQLYLGACKLLETLCTLPSGYMAQFQMCHWAFVSSGITCETDSFIPFASRIARLLFNKESSSEYEVCRQLTNGFQYGQFTSLEKKVMSASLLNLKSLTSFSELRPLFSALSSQSKILSTVQSVFEKDDQLRDAQFLNGSLSYSNAISRLEHSLFVDFAEHWQL